MLKFWINNKYEINEKLFKYMIMHVANDRILFSYIQRYIPQSKQVELLDAKLAFIETEKLQQYIQQIVNQSKPTNIGHALHPEILQVIHQNKQREITQYMLHVYNNSHKIKIEGIKNNICFLSGRTRAVYRAFHLSRLKIREYAQSGQFIGLQKISW